jgi:hypothetical protein
MFMFARLTMTVLAIVLALPQTAKVNNVVADSKDCTDSKSPCGLSGVDRSVLLKSLLDGMSDLPTGFAARGIGFPADVLAAAYGIDDGGREFSFGGTVGAIAAFPFESTRPHYYSYRAQRAMIPRLERTLAFAKLHMSEPARAPALVAVNVPGIGPRIYDADQIRALVGSGLFPYAMRVEWKRSSGVRVPFVQLDRKAAQFSRACLTEIVNRLPSTGQAAKTGNTGCPIALNKAYSFDQGPPAMLSVTESVYTMFARPMFDETSVAGTVQEADKAIESILVRETKDEKINVTTRGCILWQDITRNRPTLTSPDDFLGCEFVSTLDIPRAAGSAYSELRVRVTPLKPTVDLLVCGPDDKDLDVSISHDVTVPNRPCDKASWVLSGDILSPSPGHLGNQSLIIFIGHRRSKDDPLYTRDQADKIRSMFQVEIRLEGTLKPWWQDLVAQAWGDRTTYLWCVPGPCPIR